MTVAEQAISPFDARTFSAMQTLRDGRRVEIRAQRHSDAPGLLAAVGRFSEDSLTRRFFGAKRHFSDREVAYFVDIDFVTHVALVAVADEGEGVIVAGGRYIV